MAGVEFTPDDFNKTFEQLNKTLERIDATMLKVAQDAGVLGRAFGSTDTFRGYVKAIEGVEDKTVNAFVNISKATAELAKSMQRMTKHSAGGLGAVVGGLKKFTEELESIKPIDTTRLDTFFKNFEEVLQRAKKLPSIQEDVLRSISSISSVVNALAGISNEALDADVMGDNLQTIANEVRNFVLQLSDQQTGVPALSTDTVKSLNAIGAIIRAVRRIAVEEFPEEKEFSERMTGFAKAIREFSTQITSGGGVDSAKLEAASDGIRKTINSVSQVAAVAVRITSSKFDLTSAQGFAQNIGAFITSMLNIQNQINTNFKNEASGGGAEALSSQLKIMGSLIKAISQFAKADLSKISIPETMIQDITRLLRVLGGVETLNDIEVPKPDRIGKAQKFLGAVSDFGGFVGKILYKRADNQFGDEALARLGGMTKSFSQLGSALVSLNTAVSGVKDASGGFKVDPVNVKNIGKTFFELGKTLKIGAFILNIIPGGDALDNFAKNLQRLGIGISGIQKAVAEIKFDGKENDIKKIGKILFQLGTSLKFSSFILQFGNDKNASAFADVIASVTTSIKSIAKLGQVDTTTFKKIDLDSIVKIFERIFKATKHLRGGIFSGKLPDVGNLFEGLTKLLKTFSSQGDVVRSDNFREFPKAMSYIGKGIAELNKIQLNPTQASLLAQQLTALSGIQATRIDATGATASALMSRQMEAPTRRSLGGFQNAVMSVVDAVLAEARSAFAKQFVDGFSLATNEIVSQFQTLKIKLSEFLRDFGQQLEQFGVNAQQIGAQILQGFSIQTLFQSGQFNVATEFEAISSRLASQFTQSEGGPTIEEQLADAQEFADFIGIQYPLSANQALDAVLDLTKAGQDLTDIQNILPSAADLASLTEGGNLQLATSLLIGAAQGFDEFAEGVAGSYANLVVATDSIVAAADVSTASIEQLAEGLSNVGPAANQMGLTLEDTVAALAVLNDGMIQGADAGTALRGVLGALIRPQTQEELERLGIAITDNNGNIRNLNDIFQELRDRYTELGFSQVQVNESLSRMFDTYSRSAASVLLVNDGFAETVEAMDGVASASDKARQQIDNLRGDMDQLAGSAETLFKNVLFPSLERFMRPLVQGVLAFTNALLELPPVVTETASTFIVMVAALGTFTGSLSIAVGVMAQFGGAILTFVGTVGVAAFSGGIFNIALGITAFSTSLLIALPVVLAFAGGLTALAYVVTEMYRAVENNLDGAGDAFAEFSETITEAVESARRVFGLFLQGISAAFAGTGGNEIAGRVTQFFEGITAPIRRFVDFMNGLSTRDIAEFIVRNRQLFDDFISGFSLIRDGIASLLTFTKGFTASIDTIEQGLTRIAIGILGTIQRVFGVNLTNAITDMRESFSSGIQSLVQSLFSSFRDAVIDNRDVLRTVLLQVVDFVNPFKKIEGFFKLIGMDNIASYFGEVAMRISTAVGSAFDLIVRLLQGQSIGEAFSATFGTIGVAIFRFVTVLEHAGQTIGTIFSTIIDALSFDDGAVEDKAITPLRNIQQFFEGFIHFMVDAVATFDRTVLVPLSQNLPKILANIQNAIDGALRFIAPLIPYFNRIGEAISGAFRDVLSFLSGDIDFGVLIERSFQNLGAALGGLIDFIGQSFAQLGANAGNVFIENIGLGIKNGDWLAVGANLLVGLWDAAVHALDFVLDRLENLLGNRMAGVVAVGLAAAGALLIQFLPGFIAPILGALGTVIGFSIGGWIPVLVGAIGLALVSALGLAAYNMDDNPDVKKSGEEIVGAIGMQIVNSAVEAIPMVKEAAQFIVSAAIEELGKLVVSLGRVPLEIGALVEQAFTMLGDEIVAFIRNNLLSGIENELLRGFATVLTEALGGIVRSFGALIALIPKTIGSLVSGIGASFIILGRLVGVIEYIVGGLMKLFQVGFDIIVSVVTGAWNGIVAVTTAAFSAILTAARNIWGTVVGVFQGGIDIIQQVFNGLFSFARGILASVGQFFGSIFNGVLSFFSEVGKAIGDFVTIHGPGLVLMLGTITLAIYAVRNASNTASTALLRNMVLFTAAAVVVEAFGQALIAATEEGGDALDGMLRFFERIGENVLNLLGMQAFIPQWNENWRMAEIIVRHFVENLVDWFVDLGAQIALFAGDVRFRIEEALGGSAGTEAYFNTIDAFANAGEMSAEAFFESLSSGLENPDAQTAVAAAMRVNGDTILAEFDQAVQRREALFSELNSLEDPSEALLEQAAAADRTFEQGIAALAVSGTVDEFLRTVEDANLAQRIVNIMASQVASGDVSANAFTGAMDDYFASLVRTGFFGEATSAELTNFRETLDDLLSRQLITQEQFDFAIMQIPEEVNQSYERATFNMGALNTSIRSELVPSAIEAAATLAQLREQVDSGAISQDDYLTAVDEVSDGLVNQISAIRDNRKELLRQARDLGRITEEEFQERMMQIERETAALSAEERNRAIESLMTDFEAGRITAEQYAAAIGDVNAANVELQNSLTLEAQIRELNEVFGQTQDVEAYTAAINELTQNIDAANRAGEIFDPNATEAGVTTPDTASTIEGLEFGTGSEEATQEAERNAEEIARIQEDIAKSNEEFAIDQKRQMEDDIQAVREKEREIADIQKEAAEEEAEREAEFALETSRRLEDFQRKLGDIYEKGSDTLEDAISERDSAAALNAMEQRDKEVSEAEQEFALDEKRRQEDRAIERLHEAKKRAERLAAAQQELADLIAKQMIERQRRLEDHQRRLQEMQAELAAKQAAYTAGAQQNMAYAQQTVATTNSMYQAIVGGAVNAVAAIGAAINAAAGLISRLRQVSQQAGSFSGVNVGAGNIAPGGSSTGGGQGGQSAIGSAIGSAFGSYTGSSSYTGSTAYGANLAPYNTGGYTAPGGYQSFDTGGSISRTGLAMVHAGEVILNQMQQRAVYAAMNRQTELGQMEAGRRWSAPSGGGISVNVDLSGMQITGANTNNAEELASAIEQRVVGGLTNALQKYNNGKRGL